MKCTNCGNESSKVVDKRNNKENNTIRRRRECISCTTRYTTYERIDSANFLVRKRSGRVEEYDRQKLKNSILKGTKKRNIAELEVEKLLEAIELTLTNKHRSIITSAEIGQAILDKLKELDKVAYMLYATVYLDFTSIEDIENELKKLTKTN